MSDSPFSWRIPPQWVSACSLPPCVSHTCHGFVIHRQVFPLSSSSSPIHSSSLEIEGAVFQQGIEQAVKGVKVEDSVGCSRSEVEVVEIAAPFQLCRHPPHEAYSIFDARPETRFGEFSIRDSPGEPHSTTCGWIACFCGYTAATCLSEEAVVTADHAIHAIGSGVNSGLVTICLREDADSLMENYEIPLRRKRSCLANATRDECVRVVLQESYANHDFIESNIGSPHFRNILMKRISVSLLECFFITNGNFEWNEIYTPEDRRATYWSYDRSIGDFSKKTTDDILTKPMPELQKLVRDVRDGSKQFIVLLIPAQLPSYEHWIVILLFHDNATGRVVLFLLDGLNGQDFTVGRPDKEYWNLEKEFVVPSGYTESVKWLVRLYLE